MDDIAANGANSAGSPRYVLVSDDDATDAWGTCLEIKNFFAAFDDPDAEAEWRTLELLGWSPDGSLRKYRNTTGDGPQSVGNAWIHVLDYEGRRIGSFWSPDMEVLEWCPSREDSALVDATVEVAFVSSPYPAAESMWERWRSGRPTSKNVWAEYRPEDRRAWLSVAVGYHFSVVESGLSDDPPSSTYHLDGSDVVDEMSFFCAMGEAINGPGGYFGWDLNGLDDCFNGGFGATPPLTLIWHDFEVARTHLGPEVEYVDPDECEVVSYSPLHSIMEILQEHVNVLAM